MVGGCRVGASLTQEVRWWWWVIDAAGGGGLQRRRWWGGGRFNSGGGVVMSLSWSWSMRGGGCGSK